MFRQLRIQTLDDNDAQEWLASDKSLDAVDGYTDSEIVKIISDKVTHEGVQVNDSDSEEEGDLKTVPIPSNSELIDCFNHCLPWLEHQLNTEFVQLMQLRRMRGRAIECLKTSKNQTSVLAFSSLL